MAKESQNKDLAWIKKHYGEKMSHLCREFFPTILETKGLLPKLLSENFAQSRSLAEDIEKQDLKCEFKSFLYSLIEVKKQNKTITHETPQELMSKAGYILFPECKTEKDIQSFRHYYDRGSITPTYDGGQPQEREGEELCTFNGGRLSLCRVWFAVKKEVAEDEKAIKRSVNPDRQDEYGTSVISIQFSIGANSILSIKNRYNHSVDNPDATFGNNLDNIIEGLTNAFCENYNISMNNLKDCFYIKGYVKAKDGKYYKYNNEINNIYYCENNIIIDNFEVKKLENRYRLIDYYIFDLSENKVFFYDKTIDDCFIDTLGEIEKIFEEEGENNFNRLRIKVKNGVNILITFNKNREMIKLFNPNVIKCGSSFMLYNNGLKELSMQNLTSCGEKFLFLNLKLEKAIMPSLESCGNEFMNWNEKISTFVAPKLKSRGENFMFYNETITDKFEDIDQFLIM